MKGTVPLRALSGKVIRKDAEMIVIFRVFGKYYPATDYNSQLFETYLYTGDISYLQKLENEVDL